MLYYLSTTIISYKGQIQVKFIVGEFNVHVFNIYEVECEWRFVENSCFLEVFRTRVGTVKLE